MVFAPVLVQLMRTIVVLVLHLFLNAGLVWALIPGATSMYCEGTLVPMCDVAQRHACTSAQVATLCKQRVC